MDDVIVLSESREAECERLEQLDNLIVWAGRKFKANISRSVAFAKGVKRKGNSE